MGGCDLQVAFVLGLGETFNGDIYTQLAEHPFMATLLVGTSPPKQPVQGYLAHKRFTEALSPNELLLITVHARS